MIETSLYSWKHTVLDIRYGVRLGEFTVQRLISDISRSIVTRLCNVLHSDPYLVRNLEFPPTPKMAAQNH